MTVLTAISADSHVLEPFDLWTTRLAGGPFEDRAPRMVEDSAHGHVFAVDGLRPFAIGLALPVAGKRDEPGKSLTVMERIEPAARLIGIDLGHELLGHRLELLLHSRLHLDGGDDADHALFSY